jgi:hypothetical protein
MVPKTSNESAANFRIFMLGEIERSEEEPDKLFLRLGNKFLSRERALVIILE